MILAINLRKNRRTDLIGRFFPRNQGRSQLYVRAASITRARVQLPDLLGLLLSVCETDIYNRKTCFYDCYACANTMSLHVRKRGDKTFEWYGEWEQLSTHVCACTKPSDNVCQC